MSAPDSRLIFAAKTHRPVVMLEMSTPRLATSVRLMCDAAAEYGIERDRCLRGTDITEAQLCEAGAQVSLRQEIAVIRNFVEAMPDQWGLGVEIGKRYHTNMFGIWGFALLTSPTPRAAINTAIKYAKLSFLIAEMRLTTIDGAPAIAFDTSTLEPSIRGFVVERHLAATLNFTREFNADFDSSRYKVHITARNRDHAHHLSEALGIEVVCGRSEDALVLPNDSLDRPLAKSDPATLEYCLDQCRALLEKQAGTLPPWSQLVTDLLVGELGTDVSIGAVAAKLAVSERTLRRRLSDEGTSFRQIYNNTRLVIARELLETAGLTVQAAAWRVGYAEPAAFVRAFAKRFGRTPGSVRDASG